MVNSLDGVGNGLYEEHLRGAVALEDIADLNTGKWEQEFAPEINIIRANVNRKKTPFNSPKLANIL